MNDQPLYPQDEDPIGAARGAVVAFLAMSILGAALLGTAVWMPIGGTVVCGVWILYAGHLIRRSRRPRP